MLVPHEVLGCVGTEVAGHAVTVHQSQRVSMGFAQSFSSGGLFFEKVWTRVGEFLRIRESGDK